MKKLLLFSILFTSTLSFGQLKKIELTPNEINFIGQTLGGGFSKPEEQVVNSSVDLNKTIFFFEIELNGKVLFKEVLRRSNPFSYYGKELRRTSVGILLRFSDLETDKILELLEDSKWTNKKIGNSKFLYNEDFNLLTYNNTEKSYIPTKTKEGFEVKLYKIVEE